MYLTAISHIHGAARLISDLDEPGCDDRQLTEDLLKTYRESTTDAVDMACEVGARTLASTGADPDVIIYATETDAGVSAVDAGTRLANSLGRPSAVVLTVAGHGCGNLGLLLRVARGFIDSSPAILLVTSDRVASQPRMMPDGLSVLSDGAAAVLATRDIPAGGSPTFVVRDLSISVDTAGSTTRASLGAQRRTVRLGRRAVAALTSSSRSLSQNDGAEAPDRHRGLPSGKVSRSPEDFTWALFNNYRLSAQKFLCGAGGFSAQQLLLGPVSEYAHAFAADLLVNCDLFSKAGSIKTGDRLALSATGPSSWALIDLEVCAA